MGPFYWVTPLCSVVVNGGMGVGMMFHSGKRLNFLWNIGSISAVSIVLQVISGLIISMTMWSFLGSFDMMGAQHVHLMRVEMVRYIHANICSLVFMVILVHLRRNVVICISMQVNTWKIGVGMLIISIGAAFFGYVIPWGQMSL